MMRTVLSNNDTVRHSPTPVEHNSSVRTVTSHNLILHNTAGMDEVLGHYQLDLLHKICKSSGLLQQFGHLRTDDERFRITLGVVVDYADLFLDSGSELRCKNSKRATELWEYGNHCFADDGLDEAVQRYTESIMYATVASEELALSYANRSAALFNLGNYEDSIQDIDRALNGSCPDRLKMKLHKRKGLSLRKLGRPGAETLFQEALQWVDQTTLTKAEMSEARSQLEKSIAVTVPLVVPPSNVKKPPLLEVHTPNPEIPCVSEAVVLKYSKKFGRHLVAKRPIKYDEILVLEKPYCKRRIPKNARTHCAHCLNQSSNMIPCEHCVNEAYCSGTCKDKAWDEYHEGECPVLGYIRTFKIGSVLEISLRMMLMASQMGRNLDSLREVQLRIDGNEDPRTKGFCDDGKFHSDQYCSIYSLVDHADKCNTETLLHRAFWVALTICLLAKETEMFGEKLELDTLENNADVVFVGSFLLKNVHICSINLRNMYSDAYSIKGTQGDLQTAVCSLINHSCDPNSSIQILAGYSIVHATRPIKRGEQIFVSYGPRYTEMRKRERQEDLRDSYFNCQCIACREDWPLLKDSPSH